MSNEIIVKEISVTDAKELSDKGVLLVDVREKDEVAAVAYGVEKIVNIPLSEFESRFEEIPTEEEVVMVCRSGKRSYNATAFLLSKGYTNVVNMAGGILGWQQYGLDVK